MTAYTCSSPRCGFKAFSLARVELGTCLGRCGERYMRRGDGFLCFNVLPLTNKAVVKSQICAHGRVLGRVPAWAFAPALVELGEWLGRDHERLACNAECIRSVRRRSCVCLSLGGVASHDDREHAIPIDLWRLGHPPSSCGAGAMAGMRL